MVTPLPGSYCPAYKASGTAQDFTDEAMEEVILAGHERYTVYRITNPAKRNFWKSETPAFELQTHGAGDFNSVTPDAIWMSAGYIVFDTPRNSDDVLQCATGKYKTYTQIFGCSTKSWEPMLDSQEITCDMDTAKKRAPTVWDWKATLEVFWCKLRAELITTTGATNGNILYQDMEGGTAGNLKTIAHSNPGGDNALSVAVVGGAITVTLETASGVIQSTAREVINAVNADADVRALKIKAFYAPGETGTGLVGAFTATALAGGLDNINYDSLLGEILIFKFFSNYVAGNYDIGYGIIKSCPFTGKPTDHLKLTVNVEGAQNKLYRVVE